MFADCTTRSKLYTASSSHLFVRLYDNSFLISLSALLRQALQLSVDRPLPIPADVQESEAASSLTEHKSSSSSAMPSSKAQRPDSLAEAERRSLQNRFCLRLASCILRAPDTNQNPTALESLQMPTQSEILASEQALLNLCIDHFDLLFAENPIVIAMESRIAAARLERIASVLHERDLRRFHHSEKIKQRCSERVNKKKILVSVFFAWRAQSRRHRLASVDTAALYQRIESLQSALINEKQRADALAQECKLLGEYVHLSNLDRNLRKALGDPMERALNSANPEPPVVPLAATVLLSELDRPEIRSPRRVITR